MNRIEKGYELMQEIFGQESAYQVEQTLADIYPPMLDFLKGTFGDIYAQDTLDLKTKEIIVLSSLITQKDTKPQLKLHIKASLKAGITRQEILALILHLVLYVGFPGTLNALYAAKEAFDEVKI